MLNIGLSIMLAFIISAISHYISIYKYKNKPWFIPVLMFTLFIVPIICTSAVYYVNEDVLDNFVYYYFDNDNNPIFWFKLSIFISSLIFSSINKILALYLKDN